MLYGLYKDLLKEYKPENIKICGSSSGGALAIALSSHINYMNEGIPQPKGMYLSSPGTFIQDPKDLQLAKELSKKDILMDWKYMETAKGFTMADDTPEYMCVVEKGNYKGLEEVYLCFGQDECLYAGYNVVKRSFERDGVKVISELGKGLYHCYPFFPLVNEAKPGWNHMIEYLKS